jgi:hypothetical protein
VAADSESLPAPNKSKPFDSEATSAAISKREGEFEFDSPAFNAAARPSASFRASASSARVAASSLSRGSDFERKITAAAR